GGRGAMAAPAPAAPAPVPARSAAGAADPGLAAARRSLRGRRAAIPPSRRPDRRAAGAGGRTQGAGGLGPLRGDQPAGHPARLVLAQRAAVPEARPRGQAAPRHQGPWSARLPVHPHPGPGAHSLTTAADPPRAGAGAPPGRAGPVLWLGRVDAPRRLRRPLAALDGAGGAPAARAPGWGAGG